jgi:hypothetical protein
MAATGQSRLVLFAGIRAGVFGVFNQKLVELFEGVWSVRFSQE